MNPFRMQVLLSVAIATVLFTQQAVADPYPDQVLKFQQLPLNNGAVPYYAGPGAPYPGHDETSTAYLGTGGPPVYHGTYMADDFADNFSSPVVHVRWWGSYLQDQRFAGVRKFLISFEHDVPATPTSPSHPDFGHRGNLHQIVDLAPLGTVYPPAGLFTEKPVPTPVPPGGVPPREGLWEYNAELHLDKWFPEQRDTVYWLKIVALVDLQQEGPIEWGWHNRDWSIMDPLASPVPLPGEHVQGMVPGPGGLPEPVWHFQDDSVEGIIDVGINPTMPWMPEFVNQQGFVPQKYLPPWDGPTPIIEFSKDLAFELYTVPEPGAGLLLAAGVALIFIRRKR
jgi:hypothetical protein